MKKNRLKRKLIRKLIQYENYILWMISTIIFTTIIMLIAQHLFEIKLPFIGWQVFFESITTLGFVVSVFSAWWGISNDRRQAEKTQTIKRTERLFSRIEKIESNIVKQEEFDKRLEYSINKVIDKVSINESLIGRLNAQIHQIENEEMLKRHIARLEEKINSKC